MSVLNNEDLDRQQTREVEVVQQVKIDFEKDFNSGRIPVLLIDPQHEIDVRKLAEENNALYMDLSTPIDYPQLCRIALDNRSIIFDNIDNIPDTEDREDIQYLVKYALRKEEDVPTPYNTSISFINHRIGARCRQTPDYLYEGSEACPIYCVVPQE